MQDGSIHFPSDYQHTITASKAAKFKRLGSINVPDDYGIQSKPIDQVNVNNTNPVTSNTQSNLPDSKPGNNSKQDDMIPVGYDSQHKPIYMTKSQIDSINGNQADSMANEGGNSFVTGLISPYKQQEKLSQTNALSPKQNIQDIVNATRNRNFVVPNPEPTKQPFENYILPAVTTTAERNNLPAIKQNALTPDEIQQYKNLNLPQTSVTDVNPNEQKLKTIANAIEDSALGKGQVGSIMNPLAYYGRNVFNSAKQGIGGLGQIAENIGKNNPEALRGLGNTVLGGVNIAMNLIPAVAGLNVASPILDELAKNISEKYGANPEKVQGVINTITPFIFGKYVGAGALLGKGAEGLLDKSGILKNLKPKDQNMIKDIANQLVFFTSAAAGEGLADKFSGSEGELKSQQKQAVKNDEYINNELNRQFLNAKRNKKVFDSAELKNYSDQLQTPEGKAKLDKLYQRTLDHNERTINRNPDAEVIKPGLKGDQNALRKPSAGSVLQRQPEEVGKEGSKRGRMEQSQQGDEVAGIQDQQGGQDQTQKEETPGEAAKSQIDAVDTQGKLPDEAKQEEPIPLSKVIEEDKQQKIQQRKQRSITSKEYSDLKDKVKDSLKNILDLPGQTSIPEVKNIDPEAEILKSLEPQRKQLESQYGKLEDLSQTELQNLQNKQPEKVAKQPLQQTETSYRGQHQIKESATTADNLLKAAPKDLFEHINDYYDLSEKPAKESYRILKQIQGKPDAEVTIYRAVPKGIDKINEGDWVSLSKTYAKEHGTDPSNPTKDMPIISQKVKAKDIGWDGNDINEFSYNPKGELSGKVNQPEGSETPIKANQETTSEGQSKPQVKQTSETLTKENQSQVDKSKGNVNTNIDNNKSAAMGMFDRGKKDNEVLTALGMDKTPENVKQISDWRKESEKANGDIVPENKQPTDINGMLNQPENQPVNQPIENIEQLPAEIPKESQISRRGKRSRVQFYEVSPDKINVDLGTMQNRSKDYDETTYNSIRQDVKNGNFDLANIPPVMVYKDGDGKLWTLNHSRLKAYQDEKAAGNKDFSTIPVQEIKANSLEEAGKLAREKTNIGAKETPIERAKLYRKDREDGLSENKIIQKAKQNEGKNSNHVLNISHLNPKGDTINAYNQVGENVSGGSVVRDIADYIGQARSNYPQLTDAHENELFKWLYDDGQISKFNSKLKFLDNIDAFVNHASFEPNKPIGVGTNKVVRGSNTIEIDNQLNDARKRRADIEKERKDFEAGKALLPFGLTPESYLSELTKKIANIDNTILDLTKDRRKAVEADKLQDDLFSQISEEMPNERAEEIISQRPVGELQEFTKDIESKAKTPDRISTPEITDAIKKSDELIGKLPEEKTPETGTPRANNPNDQILKQELDFNEGRSDHQKLQDRKKHLELAKEELSKIPEDKISDYYNKYGKSPRKAIADIDAEIKSIDKTTQNQRAKESQLDIFGSTKQNQESLFQKEHNHTKTFYEGLTEKGKKNFIDEISKGVNSEWLIGQENLSKEQAAGLTDLIKKSILYDPKTADITTAWEESLHASMVTLAKPFLAKSLLRENGWDGKGDIWDVKSNQSLRESHETLAKKYIEWRDKQENDHTDPKTRTERLFQSLRELWAKTASYLNRIGFTSQAGYFYDLAKGKLREQAEKISNIDYAKEIVNSQTNFGKSIDESLKGKLNQPTKVADTPEILIRLGAKQLPIMISPRVIEKSLISKHDLTPELLKDLPVELHDPIMVFDSATVPNSFVIMTELRSPTGNIVAAIHLNEHEQNHIVNRIGSVYGKDRDGAFIDWIKKGLLRYINKNKSQIWLRSRGLQLPKEVTEPDLSKPDWRSAGLQLPMETTKFSDRNVLTENDFVNSKLKQQLLQGLPGEKKLVEYKNEPKDEIEKSLLKAYNGFDNSLPSQEKIISQIDTTKQWSRQTQYEETKRVLGSFLSDYVKRNDGELISDYIRRALKAKPELQETYDYLRTKLYEAVKERQKDENFLSDYKGNAEGKKIGSENTIQGKEENRIISEESYLKAKNNLRKNLAKLNAGIDPTNLKDLATIGAYHVEGGLRNFTDWGKKMIEDFGDRITPHLLDIWRQTKKDYPHLFGIKPKGEFGTIYSEYSDKPNEAIEHLLKVKEGEVPGALHHKDIGKIDLIWGKEGKGKDDGYGLAKIAKYHPEVLGDMQNILDKMSIKSKTENRIRLESPDHEASIRLNRDGKEKTWLLTAYEKKAGGTTNVSGAGKSFSADRTSPLSNTNIKNNYEEAKNNAAVNILQKWIGKDTPMKAEYSKVLSKLKNGEALSDVQQRFVDRITKNLPEVKSIGEKGQPEQSGVLSSEVKANKSEEPAEDQSISGISQRVREARADLTKVPATERGIGWSGAEALQRGRDLLRRGETAEGVIDEFKKSGKISDDGMAIVRARNSELQKATNEVGDAFGVNSKEYKDALKKENDFLDNIKPMQTQSSRIFTAQQGGEDIDTGTYTGLVRAFTAENKTGPTEAQSKRLKELATENKYLNDRINESEAKAQEYIRKYSEALDRRKNKEPSKSIKIASKELADKIRNNAKIHKPGIFYSATPASLAWDLGVEAVAQTIEKGGALADAIQRGVEKVKETDWYKSLAIDKKNEAEKQFRLWHENETKTKVDLADLQKQFVDKKDFNFTPQQRKQVWQYAKDNYIDKGQGNFQDMVSGISKDLGLSPEQVRRIIAEPKTIRDITDATYKLRNERQKAVTKAKIYIRGANTPAYIRLVKNIPNAMFGWFTFGHGTVFGVTHAGMEMFKPTQWATYFPAFLKQFKFAYGNTAVYEKAMTDLKDDPNFIMWKRTGLAVDPERIYDDYRLGDKYFGKVGLTGERGFNAWKIYRLEIANKLWGQASEIEKQDPNTAKYIADFVNHSTGTSNIIIPNKLNTAFFAPRLEASRWARIFVEPAKALKTFIDWDKASAADKFQAKLIARKGGEMLATYSALLAANQAILNLSGSNQSINFTNPMKTDWMRFKVGGKVIDVSGGMLSTTTFLARLLEASIAPEKDINKLTRGAGRSDLIISNLGKYARGKLSPFGGTAYSMLTRHDYAGNTLPPFDDKPLYKDAKHLSWGEYLGTQMVPIPISEGVNDVMQTMKNRGMSSPQIETILNGIFISAVAGGTGARVRDEYKPTSKTITARSRTITARSRRRIER
jgi:hypothetical protein